MKIGWVKLKFFYILNKYFIQNKTREIQSGKGLEPFLSIT